MKEQLVPKLKAKLARDCWWEDAGSVLDGDGVRLLFGSKPTEKWHDICPCVWFSKDGLSYGFSDVSADLPEVRKYLTEAFANPDPNLEGVFSKSLRSVTFKKDGVLLFNNLKQFFDEGGELLTDIEKKAQELFSILEKCP